MKTDSELEALLRGTLDARAGEVTEPARWATPAAPRRRTPAWLPAVAAAAAVVVVAAGVIIGIRATRSNPPAHHSPRPTPTSLPNTLHTARCVTAVPASWQRAITTGTVREPGTKLVPRAVDDNGDVIADRAADVAVPQTHQLVLITQTHKVRVLYDTAPPASWNGMRIGTLSTEGDWVAFAVLVRASSGGQGPAQVELANTVTGETRTLRPTQPNDATIVLGPVVAAGSVFWTELEMSRGLAYGPVYRYDIGTRTRHVVANGVASTVLRSGEGIYWEKTGTVVTARRGTQPPGFDLRDALLKDAPVFTSGDTSVWQDVTSMQAISGWRRGMSHSTTVVPERLGGLLAGMTGSFVWWEGGVADVRTGATAPLGGAAVVAGAHTVALQEGTAAVAVVDTGSLPGLHC
jgi:hypothetical protein